MCNKIFVTSDLHLSHDRGFIYEPRGFKSVAEMNEAIIQRWNEVVDNDDDVYLLGDLMLNDNVEGWNCMRQLNGRIHVLFGNHDTNARIEMYKKLPNVTIEGYAIPLEWGRFKFYLSHYPTMTSNLENNAHISQHVINLFGHTHQKAKFYQDIPFMYHVGLDAHDCYPVSIETIINDVREKVHECRNML